jgi:hypothetical protein
MRPVQAILLSLFPVSSLARDAFKPADFNVTEALLNNGVNMSTIAELANFHNRDITGSCSIAVSWEPILYCVASFTLWICLFSDLQNL